jgi:hypothetical protein
MCRANPPVPVFLGMSQQPMHAFPNGLAAMRAQTPVVQAYFPPVTADCWCCSWRATITVEAISETEGSCHVDEVPDPNA